MTPGRTLLLARHPGAQAWLRAEAARRGWAPADVVAHLEEGALDSSVTRVAGILPAWLAGQLCRRGIACWHLVLALDRADRGRELSCAEMERLGARLVRLHVRLEEGE
ncbi:CRISPR-associated protein Csx16 [Thermaurantiacus tibetensis]|uniref:CRISPR-associated protein Csx16 n=1 Tax=Thermaurantiacus tibetensis TaxID=2759035 RepID=UPI00188F4867|nr:CRISPR-associated protein Csx16 [Thermaurantiacus tibetensis]